MTLKGANRSLFEARLANNLQRVLKGRGPRVRHRSGRFYVRIGDDQRGATEAALGRTFGIIGFARTERVEKKIESIRSAALRIAHAAGADELTTFKIRSKRSDKSFPLSSHEIEVDLGNALRHQVSGISVDLSHPDLLITVEVREAAYVYGNDSPGPGGLPVGCAGRGILLLSGGIDSPVAGYLLAKRGLKLDAIYFETYPYTSIDAREKVFDLVSTLTPYNVGMTLIVIPFTDIAVRIREMARPEYATLLMRACMVEIATRVAEQRGCLGIVNGDSLSQVASQTLEGMRFVDTHAGFPVYRPLVGFDKLDIVRLARSIGTYEISIRPFDDCCTVFTPKSPSTRPKLESVERDYEALKVGDLVEEASRNGIMRWFDPSPGET